MSGIFSDVSNYGGRQPDNTSYIKQFVTSVGPVASWIYKRINNVIYITPQDRSKNVLIEKDLIVNGAIINPSDESVKENIAPICEENFNKLSKLEPKSYNYINDEAKEQHFGFIAQELGCLFPELLSECCSDSNHIKGVKYIELIPLIIGKMNLMEKEIQSLKNKVVIYENKYNI